MQGVACGTSAVAVTTLIAACVPAMAQDYDGREQLRAQSNEFRQEAIRVTDGVYVAVGYSASNVILIEGDRGSIIVDTSTDPVAARAGRAADQRHRSKLLPVLGHVPVARSSAAVSFALSCRRAVVPSLRGARVQSRASPYWARAGFVSVAHRPVGRSSAAARRSCAICPRASPGGRALSPGRWDRQPASSVSSYRSLTLVSTKLHGQVVPCKHGRRTDTTSSINDEIWQNPIAGLAGLRATIRKRKGLS
jgi:hypothetical protein